MDKRGRHTLTRQVLSILKTTARTIVDIADSLDSPPGLRYKSFLSKEDYAKAWQRYRQRRGEQQRQEQRQREWHNVYALLRKLQQDGLVVKKQRKNNLLWRLTPAGIKTLIHLDKRMPLPVPRYATTPSGHLIIVTFDIPEKMRRKRKWLRDVLRNNYFSMMHKSVWIGKRTLPKAFIADLHRHNLLRCVRILSVRTMGNISEVAQ